MNKFIGFTKRICFVGRNDCNQGGVIPDPRDVLNGVVNNGIQITNNSINVVHTGG